MPLPEIDFLELNMLSCLGHSPNGLVYEVLDRDRIRRIVKFPGTAWERQLHLEFDGVPGVMPLLARVRHADSPGVMMPRGDTDLHERLRVGDRFPATILVPVARAIDAIHQRGFLHRDVHPGNFILWEGAWYLIDFGLSRDFSAGFRCDNGSHAVIRFAAPPQLQNQDEHPDDDWYSFFLVALAVRHGAFPWDGQPNGPPLLLQKVRDPLHPFVDCPAQEALLARCVARPGLGLEEVLARLAALDELIPG
ncbi:protein kinase [Myxococcota bacterium]|nr:protein kinase [Myxococcota bacterium]MBU1511928.1 protein kinase [Myxococcota bacterium]